MSESPPVRLSAFIGRSFLEEDKQVWHDLRDMLESMRQIGFAFEDAKESQLRSISEKVKERIPRNDIYIGLLTRRHPIPELTPTFWDRCRSLYKAPTPKRWTTTAWVIEEIGYAIGKDRPTIVLIEEGVEFPPSDLDADTEWISFQRTNLAASQSKLNSMIMNLIGKGISALESGGTTTDAPPRPEPSNEPATIRSFAVQLDELDKAASAGDHTEADRIQEEILNSESNPEDHTELTDFLLYRRARQGEALALDRLKEQLDRNLDDINALVWMSGLYSSFGEHHKAVELFIRSADHMKPSSQARFAERYAEALSRDGKVHEAIQLLRERVLVLTTVEDRLVIWKALASAAEEIKDKDLEVSFLEKVIDLEPLNHDLRFQLARLYSSSNRPEPSAFHYRILVQKERWETAAGNNLGVAYGAMGLGASQVGEYLKVIDNLDLAKANLADLYAEAGFLDFAESHARSVVRTTNDSTASERAQCVLSEVSATRTKEKEAIQKIGEDSRDERQFFSDYAFGYCDVPIDPFFSGVYRLGRDNIQISAFGTAITGTNSEIRKVSGLLGAMLESYNLSSHDRRHVTTLKGSIVSRVGTFELTTEVFDPPESTKPESTSTTNGLFIIEPDLQTIRLLERGEKRTRIVTANRVPKDSE